ncbi:MAG: PEGA domain-containing protein [bacterium]|nr:PEGA domain-containing protein [bacterium]
MRIFLALIAAAVLALAGYLAYVTFWPTKPGALVVLSDPPGAQVWLDLEATDYLTGPEPIPLSPGKHSIMVKMDTLEADPVACTVDIRSGATETVNFRLHAVDIRPPTRKHSPRTETARTEPEPLPLVEAAAPRDFPDIPTADELRRRAETEESAAELPVAETPPPPEPKPTTGLVEVSSSRLEARIFVNESLQDELTPTTLELPGGEYTIRVEMTGYEARPTESRVTILPGGLRKFLFFDLAEMDTVKKEILIETAPVAGAIFVDSVLVGTGRAVVPHEYGLMTVTFGSVEGYITPAPVPLALTAQNPAPEVRVVYARAFHAMAQANGPNVIATDGDVSWIPGVYFEDGPLPSAALGAKIREIPGAQKFGWELAMGDPNRNPTGGDYIEFRVTLPDDVPPDAPLTLRLYLYRAPRRYPFALSAQSEIVVIINDRPFLSSYRPTHTVEVADLERFEEWPLTGMLTAGANRVMIRAGESNTVYNYLWKFEIR